MDQWQNQSNFVLATAAVSSAKGPPLLHCPKSASPADLAAALRSHPTVACTVGRHSVQVVC